MEDTGGTTRTGGTQVTHISARRIKGRTLAAFIGLAAAAATVSGAGLASASTTGSAASSGTEHFNLMTTQPSASRYVVIASGLFTAGGIDVSGNTTDLVKLPGGSFKIHHGANVHIIKQQFNPKTCLATFKGEAAFTVSGGTGKYKRISGKGTAIISATEIAARTKAGACNMNANPAVLEQTITATAKVKL
jgi:hypothetical protein